MAASSDDCANLQGHTDQSNSVNSAAANEDLMLWFRQKLNLERIALQELCRLQCAMVEDQHTQLLIEMQAKLQQGTTNQSSPILDKCTDHEEKDPVKEDNHQSTLPTQIVVEERHLELLAERRAKLGPGEIDKSTFLPASPAIETNHEAQAQAPMVEELHIQLLAELRARLCPDVVNELAFIPDTVAFENIQPARTKSTVAFETYQSKRSLRPARLDDTPGAGDPLKGSPSKRSSSTMKGSSTGSSSGARDPMKGSPSASMGSSASMASVGEGGPMKVSPSRRDSAYRSQALRNLAGQRSGIIITDHCFLRLVKNPTFEIVCGLAIVANTLILALEIEYYGYDSGYEVDYKNVRSSEESWPNAKPWFDNLDVFFVCFFALELIFRVTADGLRKSARSPWIWFDTAVVSASVVSWFDWAPSTKQALNPTVMRIARLARMMRVFKVVRLVRVFDSLFLLIRSIQASVGALCWSFLLFIAVEMAIGMCISQLLRSYIQDTSVDVKKRREVFLLYGTFSRTMVTMFEITLANWAPSCKILMDNVSEWFGLFYILYCCCFIFAVVRVIQAVFITETNRVAAADDQIALIRKQRDKQIYLGKLKKMFDELDVSGDGHLQREEVEQVSEDTLLKAMMSTLDIDIHDLELLFDLLDDGDGHIDIDEFVKGLSRIKGSAQSIDVVYMLRLAQQLDNKVERLLQMFGRTAFLTSSWMGRRNVSPATLTSAAAGSSSSATLKSSPRSAEQAKGSGTLSYDI